MGRQDSARALGRIVGEARQPNPVRITDPGGEVAKITGFFGE
jgi:hypothetical protein